MELQLLDRFCSDGEDGGSRAAIVMDFEQKMLVGGVVRYARIT